MDLGLAHQRLGHLAQHPPLGLAAVAQVEQRVGDDLVVAAAGGVKPAARVADQLDQAPLDGGVDVLVAGPEGEVARAELTRDPRQAGVDLVGVQRGDDPLGGQHPGVGARARDVERPQAPVHRQRGVEAVERLGRAGREAAAPEAALGAHRPAGAPVSADRRRRAPTASDSAAQTRSTWASVISGKKGRAIVDALIASVTGNSPGPWPCASR